MCRGSNDRNGEKRVRKDLKEPDLLMSRSSSSSSFMLPPLSTKETSKPRRTLFLNCALCIVAAWLHLHVFLRALHCLAPFLLEGVVADILPQWFEALAAVKKLEIAVLLAYSWDMLTIALGAIPYSRARTGSEIVGHHIPVFVFLSIGLPYFFAWESIEPALAIQAIEKDRLLQIINGTGFMSSLNEFLMCSQQAENYWNAATSFHIQAAGSLPLQLIELVFKLCIFTIFPLISIIACLRYDTLAWNHAASTTIGRPIVITLFQMLRSPLYLRTLAWRAFIALQYPKMAKRTLSKLRRFMHDTSKADDAALTSTTRATS